MVEVVCKSINIAQTLSLRHAILWPEKPLAHVQLPEDENGLHFGAFVSTNEEPVAVISFFKEPIPAVDSDNLHDDSRQARFRKFACDTAFQGCGIGTKLLLYGLNHARSEFDAVIVWCDARTATADWYTKRGMTRFGETFFKGTVEYIRMYIDVSVSVSVE